MEGQSLQPTERLHHLQQLVSISREGKASEHYKKYKESYVKQLRFDPEKPNLSINLLLLLKKFNTHFLQLH